jgi:hypothetical protein
LLAFLINVEAVIEWRVIMPKDSQPDNKKARVEKANGQTPLTRENQNKNKNAKRKSIEHNDV